MYSKLKMKNKASSSVSITDKITLVFYNNYREAIVKDIEKAIAGYCQGDRKGDCWL
jgi:ribosomal 50S subunit-recycling heat shock protein